MLRLQASPKIPRALELESQFIRKLKDPKLSWLLLKLDQNCPLAGDKDIETNPISVFPNGYSQSYINLAKKLYSLWTYT
jgi:hypothetical protein